MAKIQPAQKSLMYSITPSSGTVTVDIDLAKDLSAINRRLYRQGMQYHVSGISFSRLDIAGITIASIYTAGDTWMVHNAWKKGFRMWKDQRNEATKAVGIPPGKWEDFKVELDDNSTTALTNITPQDSQPMAPDEWALSEVFWDDDGTERSPTFCLLGATAAETKIGLVQEYHISRARPDAFNPDVDDDASDSIFAKMLPMQDELSDALLGDIEDDNDNPPYDLDQMVGGDTAGDCPLYQDYFSINAAAGRAMSKSFTAECGLIRIHIDSRDAAGQASDVGHFVIVELTPGPYKGVLAAPMGQ